MIMRQLHKYNKLRNMTTFDKSMLLNYYIKSKIQPYLTPLMPFYHKGFQKLAQLQTSKKPSLNTVTPTTRTHKHTHTYMHTHTHTDTHTYIHTHTHIHMHTQMHTHMHTSTHTHITCIYIFLIILLM